MTAATPPVSVGLPVRNGMPYLVESLESILRQTFADFELLICDNASTDGTEEIARELVRADPRVRYLRVGSDSGASANFNRCLEGTRGGLFTWVASDDRLLPRYLELCADHLDAHLDHAMCVPAVRFMDEAGTTLEELLQPEELSSPNVAVRLGSYLDRRSWYMVYGLARREALARTRVCMPRFGSDVILMWEMLLRFRIGTVADTLLEYRRYQVKDPEVSWRSSQPDGAGRAPRWLYAGLFRDLLACCADNNVDPVARAAGRLALFRWLTSFPFRDLVVSDLRRELQRTSTRRNPIYEAALIASMSLLRPRLTALNVRRQLIRQLSSHRDGSRNRSTS